LKCKNPFTSEKWQMPLRVISSNIHAMGGVESHNAVTIGNPNTRAN